MDKEKLSQIPKVITDRINKSGDYLFQTRWLAISLTPFALAVIMQIAELPLEASSINRTLIPGIYGFAGMFYRTTKEMNKTGE